MAQYQIVTPAKLGQISMTSSAQLLYTTPANTRTMIKNFDMCNTTSGMLTFTIYLVPSGSSPLTTNAMFYQQTLTGYQALQWSGVEIMYPGDTIWVQASASGINIIMSGGECT